ncbi:MAG: hypothetical protein WAU17_08450 [Nitrospirales bacterium]
MSASAGENNEFQLRITSPRIVDIVGSTVELTYALGKGTKGDHVHGFVDRQYQKGFEGTLPRLTPGNITSRSQWPLMTMRFLQHRIPSRVR